MLHSRYEGLYTSRKISRYSHLWRGQQIGDIERFSRLLSEVNEGVEKQMVNFN